MSKKRKLSSTQDLTNKFRKLNFVDDVHDSSKIFNQFQVIVQIYNGEIEDISSLISKLHLQGSLFFILEDNISLEIKFLRLVSGYKLKQRNRIICELKDTLLIIYWFTRQDRYLFNKEIIEHYKDIWFVDNINDAISRCIKLTSFAGDKVLLPSTFNIQIDVIIFNE